MDLRTLQAALNERTPDLKLTVDGIAGRNTMAAVDALLGQMKVTGTTAWSDNRLVVAAEQALAQLAGIEVGGIDGLVGEQTRHAFEVYDARRANGGQPVPSVETWRDTVPGAVVSPDTPARTQWPRQKDVEAFYGPVGSNQVTLALPFPFRIAWEPERTVTRMQCHKKCSTSFFNIWKKTLEHYGHAEIVRLRLDMFGGCLNVRKMRGGSRWSMHSWGIAMDVDPDRNQLKFHRDQAELDDPPYKPFWDIVYGEGFLSLGLEKDYDFMHMQATRDFS